MNENFNEQDLEALSAYLDGEHPDAADFRLRLNADPALARRLRQLQTVRAGLAALPVPQPRADFAGRIAARAFSPARRWKLRKEWWLAAPVAAAALFLVVASLTHTPPKPAPAAPDGDAWQGAINALAESGGAEELSKWVDDEPAIEDASTGELVGSLADLSAGEYGMDDTPQPAYLDGGASVLDVIEQMNPEDAAAVAAMMQTGA